MNLDHLYYFKALVETGSRNDTARIMSITQPTLSLAISKLEKELGVSLVEKKKGAVELTKDGRAFYEYVATSLHFLDNGVALLREKQGAFNRTEINVGAIYSVQDENWSKVIYEFRQQTHGTIRINVKQSTTPALLKNLKNGVVDVAFAGTMGPDPEIRFDPCWTQEAVLAVNRHHPFSRRSEISLKELWPLSDLVQPQRPDRPRAHQARRGLRSLDRPSVRRRDNAGVHRGGKPRHHGHRVPFVAPRFVLERDQPRQDSRGAEVVQAALHLLEGEHHAPAHRRHVHRSGNSLLCGLQSVSGCAACAGGRLHCLFVCSYRAFKVPVGLAAPSVRAASDQRHRQY